MTDLTRDDIREISQQVAADTLEERMLAAIGFPVEALVRTDFGSVSLGEQRPGSIRALGRGEIGELYKAVGL